MCEKQKEKAKCARIFTKHRLFNMSRCGKFTPLDGLKFDETIHSQSDTQ